MLKTMVISAAIALAAVPQTAQTPSLTAAQYAQFMQNMTGEEFEGGIKIASITSESETLVVTITGPDGWRMGMDAKMLSDALLSGFCSTMSGFFDGKLTMRVDTVDAGVTLKGPLVSACPA